MLNLKEYLLVSLMEECAEMQQAIAKLLRFGPTDRYPTGDHPTTTEKLIGETIDAEAIIEMLADQGIQIRLTNSGVEVAKAVKKMKVEKYLKYAIQRGTLDPKCLKKLKPTRGATTRATGRSKRVVSGSV